MPDKQTFTERAAVLTEKAALAANGPYLERVTNAGAAVAYAAELVADMARALDGIATVPGAEA